MSRPDGAAPAVGGRKMGSRFRGDDEYLGTDIAFRGDDEYLGADVAYFGTA